MIHVLDARACVTELFESDAVDVGQERLDLSEFDVASFGREEYVRRGNTDPFVVKVRVFGLQQADYADIVP
jgi:hypothetical protein